MRKSAGLMIITLLLLAVPVLASAWSLTVKVTGPTGAPGNNVTLTGGATGTITSGTVYKYPSASTTATINTAANYTKFVTVDGVVNAGGPFTFSSGSHSVQVVYTQSISATPVTLTQTPGGVISVQLPNSVWTTASITGATVGSVLPITIAANADSKIVNYTLNGVVSTTGVTGAAGQVLSLPTAYTVAASGNTITATFATVPNLTASLSAPFAGMTGIAITSTVAASTNIAPLTYAWSVQTVTGGAAVATTGTASSFSFTPVVAGTYTVTAVVSSGGSPAATATLTSQNIVVNSYAASQNAICTNCHNASTPVVVANFNASALVAAFPDTTCVSCHSAAPHAVANACVTCHNATLMPDDALTSGVHSFAADTAIPHSNDTSCIGCHSVGLQVDGKVNDNTGVRAVVGEFSKWSHHVTGSTLQDAHCAACHLEGKADNGKIVVDTTKHLIDATTHLRNAADDSDMVWDPASPNHSTMDIFCMSCHSATGATSPGSIAIQAVIVPAAGKTASALNPFGDTISNRYDKMQRPAVTNVDNQFDITNNSHHAVKGARYTGRTRTAGPRAIAGVGLTKVAGAFDNNSSATLKGKRSTIYDAGLFNALYSPLGTDGTAATGLGDDSTLHCGDCHTVGQWKVGSSDTANGSPTPVAIGAHGSNNEYLLRNTLGTDQRHTQNAYTLDASNNVTYTNPSGAFLVCFNCHAYNKYGSIFVGTGLNIGLDRQPHAGEYDVQGRCNGIGNTIPFNGYTTGKATDGTQFTSRFMLPPTVVNGLPAYAGEQAPDFGNIFGIQCANCHNSGAGNAYGGIHGSANNTNTTLATVNPAVTGGAYIDGMGNTTKVQRFLPGLGNAMHVPGTLGGFTGGSIAFQNGSTANATSVAYTTGGTSNDTNWEQKHWQQTASTNFNLATGAVTGTLSAGAGCYTLGGATAAASKLEGPSVTGAGGPATELLDTWGGCEDHGAAQGKGDHGFAKRVVRPVTY